ncbi:hypothetical protein BZA05DRAFT_464779 [Tricharina praecox]|uniref:uncharacterized protein n=1 Tax=Tricharina praecox TaxID=43433 RepID=UPI00221EB65D|nr:uncharacterized protein BZA05DRAFT_464779 [Tricharina praecox]KAI5855742.1 hypothetical protein BZA05DRAFT_464779 [Tricharina praecox]
MRAALFLLSLALGVLAERPFINEPDTGLVFDEVEIGSLPSLADMIAVPDFEAAARHYMPTRNYSYYRTGSSGEYSYRRALEIFSEVRLRPRLLRDMRNVSLSASILGYDFTAPFFIAPAANAGLAHPLAELNLARAAGKTGILYAPSLSASKTIEEIAAAAAPGQIMFHQLYVSANKTKLASDLQRIEAAGYKGIFVTIDNPIHGIRQREARFGFSNTTNHDGGLTWAGFKALQEMTKLPLIPKGVQTVEDARLAVEAGVKAIYVSNHGGRQLDTSQQPLETLLEILRYAPEIFEQVDVFADGGVRYGTDVLKLLAMGVKMVGMGRPPMFANVFGEEGVTALVEVMRREVWVDAANLGVQDVKKIDPTYLNLKRLEQYMADL